MRDVGIIVALDEEREAILNIMTDTQREEMYNLKFIRGKIKGTSCILVKSGVGKINVARTTQMMLQKYDIQYVINMGTGGSTNSLLKIGDVVIGKQIVQHDFDYTAFEHSRGYISGIGDKIECDQELMNKLENILKLASEKDYNIKVGVIASGDVFCVEAWMRDRIRAKFHADVVDMESAAVAQVCYLDSVPFICIKTIADMPANRHVTEYNENLKIATKRCSNIIKELLG